jgi:hypothetical protein
MMFRALYAAIAVASVATSCSAFAPALGKYMYVCKIIQFCLRIEMPRSMDMKAFWIDFFFLFGRFGIGPIDWFSDNTNNTQIIFLTALNECF